VKVNVFLANMDDFAAVNEVYAKFFPDPKPVSLSHRILPREVTVPDKIQVRTCVAVKTLPLNTDVEIEASGHL
jgi:enamine deaminase RidA (YjgF/YER057c/UK114 family)